MSPKRSPCHFLYGLFTFFKEYLSKQKDDRQRLPRINFDEHLSQLEQGNLLIFDYNPYLIPTRAQQYLSLAPPERGRKKTF